jgi:hypothetical protein
MARTLLEPTMNRTEKCVYPQIAMVFHLTEARIGAEGNERSTELHRSARMNNKDKFDKGSFRFYESKLVSDGYCTWTNPTDIPWKD